MRYRGEFECANGVLLPNNVTTVGVRTILGAALRNTVPTFWVGLCSAVYQPDLRLEQIVEPTIGVNGYARNSITRDLVGWPSDGTLNGEVYYETLPLVWVAVGGPFDQAVTRMFICGSDVSTTGDVYALSAALPDDLVVDPTTDIVDRTFNYRLFAR